MANFPSENQIPHVTPLDDNIREVCEMLLEKCGYSRYQIAEKIREFESSENDQLTLYDAQDLEICEQMKL